MNTKSQASIIGLFFIFLINANAQDLISIGRGSTILTMVSNDSVIMCADTKRSADIGPGTVRKIHLVGDLCYGITGTGDMTNKKTKIKVFDAVHSFDSCYRKNKNLKDALSAFNSLLTPLVRWFYTTKSISSMSTDFPGRHFLSIAIVNYTNVNERLFGDLDISGDDPDSLEVIWKPFKETTFPFLDYTGRYNLLKEFLFEHPHYLDDTTKMMEKMVYLIKIQANGDSAAVNCPIDRLVIKKHKPKWLPRINDCGL